MLKRVYCILIKLIQAEAELIRQNEVAEQCEGLEPLAFSHPIELEHNCGHALRVADVRSVGLLILSYHEDGDQSLEICVDFQAVLLVNATAGSDEVGLYHGCLIGTDA